MENDDSKVRCLLCRAFWLNPQPRSALAISDAAAKLHELGEKRGRRFHLILFPQSPYQLVGWLPGPDHIQSRSVPY